MKLTEYYKNEESKKRIRNLLVLDVAWFMGVAEKLNGRLAMIAAATASCPCPPSAPLLSHSNSSQAPQTRVTNNISLALLFVLLPGLYQMLFREWTAPSPLTMPMMVAELSDSVTGVLSS